jgi:YD repeat-containing protein
MSSLLHDSVMMCARFVHPAGSEQRERLRGNERQRNRVNGSQPWWQRECVEHTKNPVRYADGSANTIRMTGTAYPGTAGLTVSCGTANGNNDVSSRIESLVHSGKSISLAAYPNLATSGFVNVASAQPGISWTLIGNSNDPETGNWGTFKQDTDGSGTWDLVQGRSANKANEITNINNTTGPAWVTPSYDKAGNMIGIPNPATIVNGTYDAWNRLITVSDASTSVTSDYDGRGFRITRTSGGVVRHYYYTPGWQCVEERTDALTSPERQFVWGLRYIDDLIIRDRSIANNGSINERRYAMQDGNWNTVAICDITGFVGERYAYSAYGTPVFMTGAGTVQASSPIGFETLYAGYRWDSAAPQMYHVRNRFLLPMMGTWSQRDPLGYVDGMALSSMRGAINGIDPYGTDDQMLNYAPSIHNLVKPQPYPYANCPEKKRAQIAIKGLQYSCSCGWIDWGHAGCPNNQPSAGLKDFLQVWERIKSFASQPGGKKGYVCYGASHSKFGIGIEISICYYVKTGLSDSESRCAAWGIFKEVQEAFEQHQASLPYFNQSGFSPEDLSSDLLLFLRATNPDLTNDRIRTICGVIEDIKDNLQLCSETDWGTRNRKWDRASYCNAPAEICEEGTKTMPKELSLPDCNPSGRNVNWGKVN